MKLSKAIKSGHPATLFASFLYFDVSFMIWTLIGALGIYLSRDLQLSPWQKGLIVSIPLLGGAIFRIGVGFGVDRIGPRRMGLITLSVLLIPLLWGYLAATSFYELILLGFLLGVAGASFAVAMPMASRCYPPEHQGIALGIAGAGNSGTMISALCAPLIAERLGWHAVFGLALIPLSITLLIFYRFAQEHGPPPLPVSKARVLSLLGRSELLEFSAYYGVTFGGYVGLASFLPIFLSDTYALGPVAAGGMVAAAVFTGSLMRPIGGYLADRMGGRKLLIGIYIGVAICFGVVAVTPSLWAVGLGLFLMMSMLGLGNGAVFQEVPQRFREDVGFVSGIIGAVGGFGGFLLPTLLGAIKEGIGSFLLGFLLLGLVSLSCAITAFFKQSHENLTPAALPPLPEIDDGRVRMEVLFGG